MIAEIIAIGNEVVDGTVVNRNASWLSEQLSQLGIKVVFHTAIPDDEELMLDAFGRASARASVVLITGGLGPTVDDFTILVAAKFFEKPLVCDEDALKKIRNYFARVGRQVTQNQEDQALVPEGAEVLNNGLGTAPGIYFLHRGVHFGFFPGVPSEMQRMFEQGFLPILLGKFQLASRRYLRVLRCFGLPEGQMDHQVRKKIQQQLSKLGILLGFRVRFPFIDIRLSVEAEEDQVGNDRLAQGAGLIYGELGKHIFGEGEQDLSGVVGQLLIRHKKTIATAESCTGGLIASDITDVPGSSEYFLEGVVAYSNQAKIELLSVPESLLKENGAVSREVVLAMARGIQRKAGSDFGIAVSGIAGPDGGSPEKPVGTVHIAVVHGEEAWERKFLFPFGRLPFKNVVSATALDRVRRILSH